jgi:holo-[acyl-carrier protein] synthase
MIVALGTDLVQLSQLRAVMERRGERFLDRILTPEEKAYCQRKHRMVESVAARFAAKEAVMKCLGTGWAQGVSWREIEVVRERGGAPKIALHGRTAEVARRRGIGRILITLTHTGDYAQAMAMALAPGG